MPDLVSVIIVAYNNWPDLELSIYSALRQTYHPIEVIVVDNGSSDATGQEVTRRFGHAVRYVRQGNQGDAGGYNAGMRLARGEFIQFLDGDDLLTPDKIEKQVKAFISNPDVDIVYGDVRYFQSGTGRPEWEDCDQRDYQDMLAVLVTPDANGISAHSMLYRRRALDRVGAWDEEMYVADRDYWLRAAWAGCRFCYCPGTLYFYRRRSAQMTENKSAMMRGFEAVWSKALCYITSEPYRSTVSVMLARLRFRIAISKYGMTNREAIAKLKLARASNPEAVPALPYALGWALIVMPGGHLLVRTPWLRAFRRRIVDFLCLQY